MLDEVQVLLTVYEVNPTLSPISTVGNQVERIFIPPSTFKNHSKTFFLVANASNSETCSRISVQGSNTDFDATFGPSLKLMLQSQDFSYGLLASIRNLPKNASICYTSNKHGSDDVKVTSISIEDIDLNVNGIILCIAFSLIVFGFFFALTYLPRFWPHCTKSCSNPDEERSEESNDDQEDNQTPLQDHAYDKRTDPKRQSKKKQHKRLYKTLVSLIVIAFIGSVIANSVYYFHLFDMDGDQDKCYFNEKCLVPNHINKVLSNLQFGLYGIALILAPIFSLKVCKLEQVSSGMGILLILQGLNSMTYHLCPGQVSLFIDRVPMHFLFSFCLYVVLNHMIPKHAKTKILLCCVVPTISVIMEVLGSFQVIPRGIGSWFLKILVLGFLVTLIADLVLYYRKWKGNYCLERLPFLILAILVLVPGSIAVFFFQAKSSDTKVTSVMSREHNQDCLVGIYDQHDLWHVFSSSAIYLGYFTLYKRYSYV